jgi:basic amino acid/polyamine antiporter, APA family
MNPDNTPELKKSLGLFDATMLVAGSMIGSGIFIVSSEMSRAVGSSGYLLLLWLITGIITLIAALSYGELAGMMPKAGGQYYYIQQAYNKMLAFLYGWTFFTVIQTGTIAAVAVAFAKYSAVFFPQLNLPLVTIGNFKITFGQLYAIASVVLLTYINCRGIQKGKVIQTVFTSAKIIALLALIILGIYIGLHQNTWSLNMHNAWEAAQQVKDKDAGTWHAVSLTGWALLGVMGATIINSLFSSDAWNNVTFIAGEIKSPERNIPRSLFLGTLIVTIIYILANIAYLSLLPLQGDPTAADVTRQGIQFAANDRVGTAAASLIFGDTAVYIMAALIMLSTFGCNNGLILSGARLLFAMSKDGLFFEKAGLLNKNAVPAYALVIQCIWASILCLSGTYNDLLEYATFAALIFYIVTIAGIFILRKKQPHAPRPYKALGYPVLPILYILIAAAICIDLLIYKTYSTGIGLGIVFLGIPVYYFSRRR